MGIRTTKPTVMTRDPMVTHNMYFGRWVEKYPSMSRESLAILSPRVAPLTVKEAGT